MRRTGVSRRELLRLEKVSKSVSGETVIEDVTLSICAGDFICIRGVSGVGKTTLLKIIALIQRPDHGNVYFLGKRVDSVNENTLALLRLKYIGYIPQDLGLLEILSTIENIMLPLQLLGMRVEEAKALVDELLCKLNLRDKVDRCVGSLSGGEKQRVAVARALAKNPLLVVADEPLSQQDDVNAGNIIELFHRHVIDKGGAVVMSTTDLYGSYPCTKDYILSRKKLFVKNIATLTR